MKNSLIRERRGSSLGNPGTSATNHKYSKGYRQRASKSEVQNVW